ncbi:MAG: hypothetical protein IRZ16_21355 [Myxococcaceae bacterium]|nr:hypothetical protein [Myxococcaceae bacterium]
MAVPQRSDTLEDMPRAESPAHAAAPRKGLGFPYGLLVALGLYALACLGYVWKTYWTAPDYLAAEHYREAWRILEPTKAGRTATRDQLEAAYRHLLEVARLKPEIRDVHDQLESLNWRFDEHGWKVPEDLRHAAEAVAMTWQKIQQANEPILVVGMRDRGWAPDQVLKGPATVAKWSPVGGLLIVALWAWWRFGAMRGAAEKNEDKLQQLEREMEDRARQRRRPGRSD